jgi:hypothetical protein
VPISQYCASLLKLIGDKVPEMTELADRRHFPRLGVIKLGIKKVGEKGPYPSATDYFVCPPEVKAIYGEKPTSLRIMFPANEMALVAPVYHKCYSITQGLVCIGDGNNCQRKIDTKTGDFAGRDTEHWDRVSSVCTPYDCPKVIDKQCWRTMSLFFILPDVPGLGVYQINTRSRYSIGNIQNQLGRDGFLRPFTKGRIAFIPLILSLNKQQVSPLGEKKKAVYILNITTELKLTDLIEASRKEARQVLLPTAEDDEPPGDSYLEDADQATQPVEQAETQAVMQADVQPIMQADVQPVTQAEAQADVQTLAKGETGPGSIKESDVPDWNALFKVCWSFHKQGWLNEEGKPLRPLDVCHILGISNVKDVYNSKQSPWKAFEFVRGKFSAKKKVDRP